MVFIQKDIYPKIIDTYIKAQNNATKVTHYNPMDNVKPMHSTTNLILNQRTSSLKNAPIMNSDKKKPAVIHPYKSFKGSQALPTFKKDLKHWGIVCD
tara:strand:- start:10769 stop:11059 length:291 start_codon:yes stop_codon:yes gene_type:complete